MPRVLPPGSRAPRGGACGQGGEPQARSDDGEEGGKAEAEGEGEEDGKARRDLIARAFWIYCFGFTASGFYRPPDSFCSRQRWRTRAVRWPQQPVAAYSVFKRRNHRW